MKFKVGDTVKIAKPQKSNINATGFESLLGKIDTISNSSKQGSSKIYKLTDCGMWCYDWMLEHVTPVKKGIYVKAEKVILADGSEGYKVLELNALFTSQLPHLYVSTPGSVWGCFSISKEIVSLKFHRGDSVVVSLLRVGSNYKKEEFLDAIKKIKVAGNMLAEINKKLKWSGVEEFTI